MLKRVIASAALAGGILVAPVAASAPASATVQMHSSTASSCYRQVGNHWNCVTPGAYCPRAAHGKYGYATATKRKYKCSEYSNHQWRWKRV